MNTASRPEIQLQLFAPPEVSCDFPEARANAAGVMCGNLIVRSWRHGSDRLIITAGRQGNRWAAGVDIRWHNTAHCYAPCTGSLHYSSADEAFQDRLRQSMTRLDKAVFFAIDETSKKSALCLLHALQGPYQEEIISRG